MKSKVYMYRCSDDMGVVFSWKIFKSPRSEQKEWKAIDAGTGVIRRETEKRSRVYRSDTNNTSRTERRADGREK
jgi:hypothetical protein